MSMFRRAEKVVVNGGHFNAINQATTTVVHIEGEASRNVVATLRRHSATAGLLNARERFDAPKCDEDTREFMIQVIKRWVQSGDDSRSSMFWLHGPAGVGKSALAQSLALALQEERDHAASFFFSRTATGRNNGAQLIATLACQLAVHIPEIRPFISRSIENNPFIFESSNKLQIEKLIIEPVNELQSRQAPKTCIQMWWGQLLRVMRLVPRPEQVPAITRYKRNNRSHIPRLIVVDGLDECDDPEVQRDLILCLGRAARDMRLPFRIIIASRPEAHIVSTFKFNELFIPPSGIAISDRNLGEDPEADKSITTFLSKEFAEIRRTHPLRNYLPDPWPKPEDIDHLVRKSSKTFIYPTTVIRYIRLPRNRPEECLRRILGMAEIPSSDKPYEILDNLYHHIFHAIPDLNKKSVFQVFQVLIGTLNMDAVFRITTPTAIEKLLSYEPGHIQHIFGDLLCVVDVTDHRSPIRILHASLSDFFLDATRSHHIYINKGEANKMIVRAYYRMYSESEGRISQDFIRGIVHTKEANIHGVTIAGGLRSTDLVQCHTWAYRRYRELHSTLSDFVELSLSFGAFVSMIPDQKCPLDVMREYISTMEDYLRDTFPVVDIVCSMRDGYVSCIAPLLLPFLRRHRLLSSLRKGSPDLSKDVIWAHTLMLIPTFFPTELEPLVVEQAIGLRHAQLAMVWIKGMLATKSWTDTNNLMVKTITVQLVGFSLSQADYYPPLVAFLQAIDNCALRSVGSVDKEDMELTEGFVLDYLRRMQAHTLPASLKKAQKVWEGLTVRWVNSRYFERERNRLVLHFLDPPE